MSERRYAFGDSDAAAERLGLLAEVFESPSRRLLEKLPVEELALVLDLGCGPGFSTALLAEILHPARLSGLDLSEAFLARARRSGLRAEWHRQDLTAPLEHGPADLIYARLVLAHLHGAGRIVQDWMGHVAPGGWLVLEEDDDILTDDPWLARYETMASGLVTARGGNLYVGSRLATLDFGQAEVVVNATYEHPVPAPVAARLFRMNFGVWRRDPLVLGRYPSEELERLGQELERIEAGDAASEVIFRIRQLAVRRPPA